MSRANLLILSVLTAGIVGLLFWNYSLMGSVDALRTAPGPSAAEPRQEDSAVLQGLKEKIDTFYRSNRADIAKLQQAVAELQKERGTPTKALSTANAKVQSGAVAVNASFKAKVEKVIDQREEAQRKQRYSRMARGMSRYLLQGIDATDQQKSEFETALANSFEQRMKLRQTQDASGGTTDRQARTDAYKQIDQERDAKVLQIFGQVDGEKIQKKLDQGFRGFFRGRRAQRGQRRQNTNRGR